MSGEFKIVSLLNPGANYNNVSGILAASLSGNTAGVLAPVSTGTLYLAGGDNITLSQDAQSVTIIGGAGGPGGGGIAVAAGTQTATTNTVVFSNSNGVTFGMSGSTRITASVATNYQTPGAYLTTAMRSDAVTLSNVNVSAGTTSNNLSAVTFSNANGVSFGLDGSTVTASIAAVGGAQTAISGVVASDATYTSGTVTFTGVGGGITVKSNTGQRIDLSVAAPVAQTNQTVGLYASSNTYLTSSGTVDARSLSFRGDKSITIGVSAGEVVFSVGAYLTTAMASNRGSDFVAATAGFNGTNASGTLASNSWSVSVAAPIPIATAVKAVASVGSTGTVTRYAPEDHQHAGVAAFAVTNTGNTAGNTRSQVGTLFLAASGAITASQSTAAAGNDTIWLSVAAQTAQGTVFSGGNSNIGNTVGDTGVVTGRLVLAGGNNVTLSGSTNAGSMTISISAANETQTVPAIGTAVKAVASIGSTGTITRFAPEDHQHAGVAAFAVTNTGNTAGNTRSQVGTFFIAASGAITASQSTAAAGNDTVWLSVAAQTTQSAIKAFGASNTGNTAGNTGVSTGIDWIIAGSNNITISESTAAGGPNTIWVSGGAGGGATGISGVVVSDTTYTSGTVSFSNQNGVTIGSSVNGATQFIRLSVAAQSNQSGNVYASSNTFGTSSGTYDARSLSIAGSGNCSVAASNSGWVVSVATQTNQTVGLYALGNTTQNSSSTFDARTISLNGLGAMTVGFSNSSVQLSVPATTLLTGVSPVSVSSAGSTISVLLNPMSQWAPFDALASQLTNSTLGQSSLFFYPFDLPYQMSASRINFFLSIASLQSAAASSGSGSLGLGYGLYSRGTGASSERLMSLTSYSAVLISYTASSDSRYAATHYVGLSNATSHSTTSSAMSTSNASTYLLNSLAGFRVVALPMNLTLTPGRYWLGVSQQSTNNAAASWSIAASYLQQTNANQIAYRPFGTSSAASNASIYGAMDGMGTYSAQSAAWPVSIGLSNSDIKNGVTNTIPYFNLSGVGTSTNLL